MTTNVTELKTKHFRGGVPTDPEVRDLLAAYPNLRPQDRIAYSDVERIAKTKHGTHRFVAVTMRWRRLLLRTQNIRLGVIPTQAFFVMAASERLSDGIRTFSLGVRRIVDSDKRLHAVDPRQLTDNQRRAHDAAVRVTSGIALSLRTAKREITFEYKASLPEPKK